MKLAGIAALPAPPFFFKGPAADASASEASFPLAPPPKPAPGSSLPCEPLERRRFLMFRLFGGGLLTETGSPESWIMGNTCLLGCVFYVGWYTNVTAYCFRWLCSLDVRYVRLVFLR